MMQNKFKFFFSTAPKYVRNFISFLTTQVLFQWLFWLFFYFRKKYGQTSKIQKEKVQSTNFFFTHFEFLRLKLLADISLHKTCGVIFTVVNWRIFFLIMRETVEKKWKNWNYWMAQKIYCTTVFVYAKRAWFKEFLNSTREGKQWGYCVLITAIRIWKNKHYSRFFSDPSAHVQENREIFESIGPA